MTYLEYLHTFFESIINSPCFLTFLICTTFALTIPRDSVCLLLRLLDPYSQLHLKTLEIIMHLSYYLAHTTTPTVSKLYTPRDSSVRCQPFHSNTELHVLTLTSSKLNRNDITIFIQPIRHHTHCNLIHNYIAPIFIEQERSQLSYGSDQL